jgi:hypothetical protein
VEGCVGVGFRGWKGSRANAPGSKTQSVDSVNMRRIGLFGLFLKSGLYVTG